MCYLFGILRSLDGLAVAAAVGLLCATAEININPSVVQMHVTRVR